MKPPADDLSNDFRGYGNQNMRIQVQHDAETIETNPVGRATEAPLRVPRKRSGQRAPVERHSSRAWDNSMEAIALGNRSKQGSRGQEFPGVESLMTWDTLALERLWE